MNTTKIFYDSEFTGLHQKTTLISIGLVSDCNQQFYAEFSDYVVEQCDSWILEHVIQPTRWLKNSQTVAINDKQDNLTLCFGDKKAVTEQLTQWLQQFSNIEIWADCLAYDWVLFCQLFGGALSVPNHIFYMPYDLATYFKLKNLNPDCDRIQFCGHKQLTQHNALDDALVIKLCYEKLSRGYNE